MWWPAIGGLVIGIGGLFEPKALGVGYDVIRSELTGSITIGTVIGILIVKTLIWSLSLGSGTSGGVLAPMFMIGGALGALETYVFPDVGPGFWALIALAGVLGGVMRSPFTGIIFSVELTHQYAALLPLIIGATTAYGVSVLVLKRSVLTEKIARRGYHLSREYDVDPLEILFISEVMSDDPVVFEADLPVDQANAALASPENDYSAWRQRLYPVVDEADTLLGVVKRGDLFAESTNGDPATELRNIMMTEPIVTHGDMTLRHVAGEMAMHGIDTMPVVDRDDGHKVIGIVSLPQLLQGRLRDQQEARERERVLRIRLIGRR
jgi:CBS domain-containing protein